MRQQVAAIGRRVSTLWKGEAGVRQPLTLSHTSDNFCLPHASLRQALPQPAPTHGMGSTKPWRPWTPAMRAGLTDRVWTLREVLLYRVPPWPQPSARYAAREPDGACRSAGQVCLRAGPTACTRPWELDGRGHDRPVDVTRTGPDRSSRISRRAQVHDPAMA
jgi:hypothetical protein